MAEKKSPQFTPEERLDALNLDVCEILELMLERTNSSNKRKKDVLCHEMKKRMTEAQFKTMLESQVIIDRYNKFVDEELTPGAED